MSTTRMKLRFRVAVGAFAGAAVNAGLGLAAGALGAFCKRANQTTIVETALISGVGCAITGGLAGGGIGYGTHQFAVANHPNNDDALTCLIFDKIFSGCDASGGAGIVFLAPPIISQFLSGLLGYAILGQLTSVPFDDVLLYLVIGDAITALAVIGIACSSYFLLWNVFEKLLDARYPEPDAKKAAVVDSESSPPAIVVEKNIETSLVAAKEVVAAEEDENKSRAQLR